VLARLELVHHRLGRPPLGRRRPRSAQDRARHRLRSRRHRRADPAL